MWALSRSARRFVILAGVCVSTQALADSNYYQNNQQFGMNLPQAALPTGSDEIRTADGTSCRSAVGGDGAYLDVGVVGAPENSDTSGTAAAYGRLVIPLGHKAKRLNCDHLYSLEIQRLKMELELARMGMAGNAGTAPAAMNSNWAEEGWGNQPAAAKPQPVAVVYPAKQAAPAKQRKSKKPKPVVAQPVEILDKLY